MRNAIPKSNPATTPRMITRPRITESGSIDYAALVRNAIIASKQIVRPPLRSERDAIRSNRDSCPLRSSNGEGSGAGGGSGKSRSDDTSSSTHSGVPEEDTQDGTDHPEGKDGGNGIAPGEVEHGGTDSGGEGGGSSPKENPDDNATDEAPTDCAPIEAYEPLTLSHDHAPTARTSATALPAARRQRRACKETRARNPKWSVALTRTPNGGLE